MLSNNFVTIDLNSLDMVERFGDRLVSLPLFNSSLCPSLVWQRLVYFLPNEIIDISQSLVITIVHESRIICVLRNAIIDMLQSLVITIVHESRSVLCPTKRDNIHVTIIGHYDCTMYMQHDKIYVKVSSVHMHMKHDKST
jgi:hypothetical protein